MNKKRKSDRRKRERRFQNDVVLRPVSPSRLKRLRRLRTVIFVVGVLLAAVLGWLHGSGKFMDSAEVNARLSVQLSAANSELRKVRRELAVHRADNEVAQQVRETLRAEIKTLHDEKAEFKEALAFYKNIMSPDNAAQGVSIEVLELTPTLLPNTYEYRVVLIQSGSSDNNLKGRISATLSGKMDRKNITLAHNEGSWFADSNATSFDFRFFQELTGRVTLPFGMEEATLEIQASPQRRGARQVTRSVGF